VDIKAYIASGIIESYVFGMTSDEETADVQSRMEEYPEVRQAVEEFSLLYEKQALAEAITPPDPVREEIRKTLKDEFKVSPVPVIKEKAPTRTLWSDYRSVAAALVAAVSFGASVFFYNRSRSFEEKYNALLQEKQLLANNTSLLNEQVNTLSEQLQLVSAPDTRTVLLKGVTGKEASLAKVYWDGKTNDVYLAAIRLDKPDDDKQYQLWAIVDGKPVDAGLLEDCGHSICKMKAIAGAQAFAITLEKKGGSHVPDLTALTVMGEV